MTTETLTARIESIIAGLELPDDVSVIASEGETCTVVRITAPVDTDADLMELDELVGDAIGAAGYDLRDAGSLGRYVPGAGAEVHSGVYQQWRLA